MSKFVDDARIAKLIRQSPDALVRHLDRVLTQEQVTELNALLEQRDVDLTLRRLEEVEQTLETVAPLEVLEAYRDAKASFAERARAEPEPGPKPEPKEQRES